MISTAGMRRLGPLLVGLYLIAQICGVVPLMSCHSAHAATGSSALYECKGGFGVLPQGHHYSGGAHNSVHHSLQDLSGVLGCSAPVCQIAWVRTVTPPPAPRALAEADTVVLERPPKPVLFV